MRKVTKAVIPAAGLGTRVLPATKAQPKEMLVIVDKPSLQYIVEELVQSGIKDIVIVTGRNKNSIEDHFDYSYEVESTLKKDGKNELLEKIENISDMANIFYVRQNHPKGLGHAILKAKPFIGDDPFVIALGDDIVYNDEYPVAKQMIDVYEKYGSSIVGCQEVAQKDVSKYGVVSKEVASLMCVNGKQILDSDVCVSFTGNAGPDAMEGKPVGLVYIGILYQGVNIYELNLKGTREEIQKQAIDFVIRKLNEKIKVN